MKSPKSVFSLVATAGVLASFNAQAAAPVQAAHPQSGKTATTAVHARELNRSARIDQGVRSGELTSADVVRLRDEERTDLQQALSQTSKDINRQKHDGQFRNPSPPTIPSPEDITKARRARRANAAATAKGGGEAPPQEAAAARTEARQVTSDVVSLRTEAQQLSSEVVSLRAEAQQVSSEVVSLRAEAPQLSSEVVSLRENGKSSPEERIQIRENLR